MNVGSLHHVEIWVPSFDRAAESYGWILEALGYSEFRSWKNALSWRLGPTYIVIEESPAMSGDEHDRLRPGINHLAFNAGSIDDLDRLVDEAPHHGWTLMFADQHPFAGGVEHHAAFLENEDGFEVELVADSMPANQPAP